MSYVIDFGGALHGPFESFREAAELWNVRYAWTGETPNIREVLKPAPTKPSSGTLTSADAKCPKSEDGNHRFKFVSNNGRHVDSYQCEFCKSYLSKLFYD